jgi:hypothetical protein
LQTTELTDQVSSLQHQLNVSSDTHLLELNRVITAHKGLEEKFAQVGVACIRLGAPRRVSRVGPIAQLAMQERSRLYEQLAMERKQVQTVHVAATVRFMCFYYNPSFRTTRILVETSQESRVSVQSLQSLLDEAHAALHDKDVCSIDFMQLCNNSLQHDGGCCAGCAVLCRRWNKL